MCKSLLKTRNHELLSIEMLILYVISNNNGDPEKGDYPIDPNPHP